MLNVDPLELEKFGELAHRWWDPNGEFKPLHRINPLRLGWIDRQAALRGRRVIDVGCGGGILTEAMAVTGAQVTGIDLSTKPLKVAQLHAIESGISGLSYKEIAAEVFAEEQPEAFDIVTCMELLEHVPQPASTVQACAALVRRGGWVFFSTINRNAKAFVQAIVGAEHVLNLLPKGTHEYARFIQPNELAAWCRAAGLTVQEVGGMQYNPLTDRYRLSADTSVNYLLSARKL